MTILNPHYNTMTKRQATRLAIESLVRTNPDTIVNRLSEIISSHDPSGFLSDALLKGFAVDVDIVDGDILRDKAHRVLDIEPCVYAHAFAKLDRDHVYINVSYTIDADSNGNPVYDHKEINIRLEDAEEWGIVVLHV